MAPLKLRRIDCTRDDAPARLAALRAQLGAQGNVVSARGRELTEKVFGEALPPVRVVERICEDVRARGAAALFHYTEQFDRVRLDAQTLRVTRAEMSLAHAAADPAFLETVRRVRMNVTSFQAGLLHRDAVMTVSGLHELRLRYRPLRRVGVMVPGGAASYPSTLLMTVCPAQAAGVPELAVVMPPTPAGAYNHDLLAVCHELGVTEVYRVGGAQAVAALAYGVEGLPAVDMIVGPGNLFVALAKRHVYGQVAIDCIAGPSEIVVLADETASAAFVASDLLAQAEHAARRQHPGDVARAAAGRRGRRARYAAGRPGARRPGPRESGTVRRPGAGATRRRPSKSSTKSPRNICKSRRTTPRNSATRIDNAGAIFLGPYTPVAVGDYAAGPSHVLPTGGTARWASGLSANDFLRRSSVLSFTRAGLARMADDVRRLARHEGLTAHAASVDVRLES